MLEIQHHYYEIPLECEYLLHAPDHIGADTVLCVALHGYGSNPDTMLRLSAPAIGEEHLIVSLRAPSQFYGEKPGPDALPAYNWGIRQHWQQVVRTHHAMVRQVASSVGEKFAIPPERRILLGFSQPVGLNYRYIGTNPNQFRGVIGICGGVPRDWEDAKYEAVNAAILHISRDQVEFYPVEVAQRFPDRLCKYASDVEFHMLPGGHRFPSKAGAIIQPWLKRVTA